MHRIKVTPKQLVFDFLGGEIDVSALKEYIKVFKTKYGDISFHVTTSWGSLPSITYDERSSTRHVTLYLPYDNETYRQTSKLRFNIPECARLIVRCGRIHSSAAVAEVLNEFMTGLGSSLSPDSVLTAKRPTVKSFIKRNLKVVC